MARARTGEERWRRLRTALEGGGDDVGRWRWRRGGGRRGVDGGHGAEGAAWRRTTWSRPVEVPARAKEADTGGDDDGAARAGRKRPGDLASSGRRRANG